MHTLTAKFASTARYSGSVGLGTLTITAADTRVAVNSGTCSRGKIQRLSARLINLASNDYLSGKTVTFQIDGNVVGTGVTGKDGYARYSYTVPSDMTVGSHTIGASFDGDTSYNASQGSGTLTVK